MEKGQNTYAATVNEVTKEGEFRARLEQRSKIYPLITEDGYNGLTYLSSFVRVKKGLLWFKIPVLFYASLGPSKTKLDLYKEFIIGVHQLMFSDALRDGRFIDPDQQEESERVLKLKH